MLQTIQGLYRYSLPSEELDVAARSAATSNSWFYMSISLVGREYSAFQARELLPPPKAKKQTRTSLDCPRTIE